jgi:Flp pilus assembly protein TadD
MAHFALGYTHYELAHYHDAYRHLRHYAELAPAQPWVWAWYAKAAAAIGETAEARDACNRALELTEAGSDETDAADLLESLDG